MDLVHTNAPFLSTKKKLKSKKILEEKYEMINRDITHLLSEMNYYFEKSKEQIDQKLNIVKENLTNSILNKNDKNIKKYSNEFIFLENQLQLIQNFHLSKENIKDIFSINVYNNIINKDKKIINDDVIFSKIQKFSEWVNLTKKDELLNLWEIIIELTKQNM